jgi:hypothetical protein
LGLTALLFALSEAHALRADEPRGDVPAEAKAKVEALVKEARELKEAGKHDEAKALMEKAESLARKLREASGPAGEKRDQPRPTPEMLERAENEIRQRRERAADLRAAGKVDEAEKLEVEAKAMAEKIRRVMAELRERESAPRDGDRRPDAPREGDRRPDAPSEGDRRPDAPREGDRRPDAPREGDRRPNAPREGDRRPDAPREGDRRPDAPREGAPRREGQPTREGAPREGAPRREGQPPRDGERRDAPPPSREGQVIREEMRELRESVTRMRAEMEELRNLVRKLVEKSGESR